MDPAGNLNAQHGGEAAEQQRQKEQSRGPAQFHQALLDEHLGQVAGDAEDSGRDDELGWPTALLFVPMLLSGLASMLGVEAARRLHPESLRRFYAVCALLCGGGCALVGAAPVLGCIFGCMLVQGVIDTYLLHEDQKFNDVIPSDQRATLISVDSMVYSLLMIPASPLVGAVGDTFGQAGAGLAVLGVLVALTGTAALGRKTRAS